MSRKNKLEKAAIKFRKNEHELFNLYGILISIKAWNIKKA